MEDLKTEVLNDMKISMKEKNTERLEAVRSVKAAIDKFEKENPNSDINYAKILKPLAKQRIDAIGQFKQAGNIILANKEEAELFIINSYLAKVQQKQMSKSEIEDIVKKYVIENSLLKSDMGKVMSYFKNTFDGQYDGKELSIITKSILI